MTAATDIQWMGYAPPKGGPSNRHRMKPQARRINDKTQVAPRP